MKTLMIAALLLFLVASIYSQTADQAMCITNASTTQAIDLARDCAGANIGDLSSLCNSGACFNRLSGIYDGCGFDGLSTACGGNGGGDGGGNGGGDGGSNGGGDGGSNGGSSGAEKLIALPVLTLVAVALSVLF